MDPDREFAYEAVSLQCHGCKAIAVASRLLQDDDKTGRAHEGISFSVKRKD